MHRSPRTPLLAWACAWAALAATSGCSGCNGCKNDHPYVPYGIDAATSPRDPTEGDDAAGASSADGGPFERREAYVAAPNATQWTIDHVDLVAPPDRVFVLGLSGDFDGDGLRDAAALVRRPAIEPDASVDVGELVLYRGLTGGALAPPQVVASPPALAPEGDCAPKHRLAQVGAHSIALETGAACDKTRGARWVAVVAIGKGGGTKVHFQATLLDPPSAPALTLDVDATDRDGDGLDDVAIRVSLEGGAPPFEPGPRVSALVRWFDRPAGMSRDPDEPDASLRALGSVAAVRAAKPKDAPGVPRYVEQVRALYRALCEGGGSPRVINLVGGAHAVGCSPSRGLEEAGLAEVRAYAVMGDAARAIAALERAQLPPATRTSSRAADAQTWITQLAPALPQPSTLRALAAVPQIERGHAPSWGALAFEASGKLLVRTAAGVVRVDPLQGDEASAEEVPPWRSGVVSPDGAYRWIEAYDACDGLALRATFAPSAAASDARELALPIAPPLGSRCERAGARGEPATTLPVAWGPRGLEAIVAGEPTLVSPDLARATPLLASLDQPVTLGAPRSPGGKVLVQPTSMGLLVHGAKWRLLRAKELDGGYAETRDCTVSDDAARVACVRGGRAFVGVWTPE